MRADSLSSEVKGVFAEIDTATRDFARISGLACPTDCGHCCESPTIEATVLDCLPLARTWIQRGEAEKWLKSLREWNDQGKTRCPVFQGASDSRGRCTEYPDRMSVCRLFGFAAVRDREGKTQVAVCSVMKRSPDLIERAQRHSKAAPLFVAFTLKLEAIDPTLGTVPMPAPQAMLRALEFAWTEALYQSPTST